MHVWKCLALCFVLLVVGAASTLGQASTSADLNARADKLVRSDPDAALTLAEQAATLARTENNPSEQARARLIVGKAQRAQGKFGDAVTAFRSALTDAESRADRAGVADAAFELGILFQLADLRAEALTQHHRAREIYAALKNQAGVSKALIGIGNALVASGDGAEARLYLEQALQLFLSSGRPNEAGPVLNSLAELENDEGNRERALELLDRAKQANQRGGDHYSLSRSHRLSARILASLGRYGLALAELDDAERRAREVSNAMSIARALIEKGRILRDLATTTGASADARRQYLEQASAATSRAYDAVAEVDSATRKVETLTLLAELREAQNDPAGAYAALREAMRLDNERRRREEGARYDILAAQFRSERQQAEIGLLEVRGNAQAAQIAREKLERESLIGGVVALAAIAVLLVVRVSERHRAAAAMAQNNSALQSALDEAERQRRIAQEASHLNQEMLGIAAHDLRGPLTTVLGYAERIQSKTSVPNEARQDAATIVRVADHMVRIVGNVLETAELEDSRIHLNKLRLDLAEIAREVGYHCAANAAAKNQQLSVDAAPVEVDGDPVRLQQALENLVSNAIKFSPPDRPIEIATGTENNVAYMRVSDQGPGLSEADRPRLFGKFQRLSARPTAGESSTGLGLAIVRRIAELHGGRAYAETSHLARGSRFVIELPLPTGVATESPPATL